MYKNELKPTIPMKLQFFAEGGEGAGDGVGAGADSGTGNDAGIETVSATSFDDLLKDPKNQSDFDKKVAKALDTAKGKWESEAQQRIDDAKTEAEKLAKMNADQKVEYERQKREEDILKREKDINTRELKAQAYETLTSRDLPKELIETLNFNDAESCNASIDAVEKAFQSAVEKAVNEKLRGNPPKGGMAQGNTDDPAMRRAMGLK